MKNEQLIPASAFIVMTTGVIASVESSNAMPGINFWLGLAIAYMIISLLGELDSDLGAGLSVLVMVSALLANGESVSRYVGHKSGGKIGTPPPKPASHTGVIVNGQRVV